MLGLWINNSLTTDAKLKLRDLRSAYTFNTQDDGYEILFVIEKIARPDTRSGFSDIKYKLENMKISHFKHDTPKAKMYIA